MSPLATLGILGVAGAIVVAFGAHKRGPAPTVDAYDPPARGPDAPPSETEQPHPTAGNSPADVAGHPGHPANDSTNNHIGGQSGHTGTGGIGAGITGAAGGLAPPPSPTTAPSTTTTTTTTPPVSRKRTLYAYIGPQGDVDAITASMAAGHGVRL